MDGTGRRRPAGDRRLHRSGQPRDRLIAKAEAAARLPLAGRVVPEKGRTDVREVFLRTYRLVYRVREDSILVLTVFEGHRLFPRGAAEGGDD